MKHLKKFNEASSIPLFSKGEILVFTKDGVSIDLIKELAKKLGYEFNNKYDIGDNEFLIKVPVGQEDVAGHDFIDNYPEFFTSFERRDLNLENMFDLIDEISNSVRYLDEYVGRSSIDPKINDDIDEIIMRLNKLKV